MTEKTVKKGKGGFGSILRKVADSVKKKLKEHQQILKEV